MELSQETINYYEEDDNLAFNKLRSDIKNYNDSIGISTDTKISKRYRNAWFTLFSFDLDGFFVGSMVGEFQGGLAFGVLSSALGAGYSIMVNETKADVKISLNTEAQLYSDSMTQDYYDSLGIIHNAILSQLYEEDSTCFQTWTKEMLITRITEIIQAEYPSYYTTDIDMPLAINEATIICSLNEVNMDTAFEYLYNQYPAKINDISIIKSYCEALSSQNNSDEVSVYTEDFRSLVNDSSISESSKELIRSSLAVAGSSNLLWNEQ